MEAIIFTDASHPDYINLVRQADDAYYEIYGDIALAYRQHNSPEAFVSVALLYRDGNAVGCGALKHIDAVTAELKRMFILKPFRRQGLGELIASQLEALAAVRGYGRIVLETGADMEAAQALYKKLGYGFIDNYGPYAGDVLCVCMEKRFADTSLVK